MTHTIVVTSTEWDNFFTQRCSELAQKEIEVPARLMLEAIDASTPKKVAAGEYHTPYILDDERDPESDLFLPPEKRVQVSAARCARVSYLTQDGIRDHLADFKLWDRLTTAFPPHASPLEHVARPKVMGDKSLGNFKGWVQIRHEVAA